MTSDPIVLVESFLLGDYVERGNAGVVWTWTDYTDNPCDGGDNCVGEACMWAHMYDCEVCDKPISGAHFVCLDGGESAHRECVTVETE